MLSINDICVGPAIKYPDGYLIKAVFLSNTEEEGEDERIPDWTTNQFSVGIPNEVISKGHEAIMSNVMEVLDRQRFDLSYRSYEMIQDAIREIIINTSFDVPEAWTFEKTLGSMH